VLQKTLLFNLKYERWRKGCQRSKSNKQKSCVPIGDFSAEISQARRQYHIFYAKRKASQQNNYLTKVTFRNEGDKKVLQTNKNWENISSPDWSYLKYNLCSLNWMHLERRLKHGQT
jgi:hypothetical protein